MNAAEILAAFVARVDRDGERSFDYTHMDTGRLFSVRDSIKMRADGKFKFFFHGKPRYIAPPFFLCEMCPNGRMMEVNEAGEIVRAWDEPRIDETDSRVGPNELLAALRTMGIDVDAMVFFGHGYCIDSIYHDSLEACAESLDSNSPEPVTRPAPVVSDSEHLNFTAALAIDDRHRKCTQL
jgi:hypothetical protein